MIPRVASPPHFFFSLVWGGGADGREPNQVRPSGLPPCVWWEYRSSTYVVSFLLLLPPPRPRQANKASRAPRQHRQAQRSKRRKTPAIVPMTIPAIAPPLSPPLSGAFSPMSWAPSVPTGATKPCVVVADAVAVMVDALVPRTGGVAVAVAQIDELPITHWLLEQTYAAPQQVFPQMVSPSSALQLPEPPPAVVVCPT